jgi:hypothetical protein
VDVRPVMCLSMRSDSHCHSACKDVLSLIYQRVVASLSFVVCLEMLDIHQIGHNALGRHAPSCSAPGDRSHPRLEHSASMQPAGACERLKSTLPALHRVPSDTMLVPLGRA